MLGTRVGPVETDDQMEPMNAEASLWILLILGAVHGLNPAMGWLFAVSLGLQEERRAAVWRAFGPLALGHGLAIGAAIAGAALLGIVLPLSVLKWIVGGALVGMGVLQLLSHRHPRLRGMRVGARELVLWSFLMASAHGAGLMALPFVLRGDASSLARAAQSAAAHTHSGHPGAVSPSLQAMNGPGHTNLGDSGLGGADAVLGTVVHTAGYLLLAVLVAVVVYEMVGLRVLRRAWLNVNLVWAAALILTGLLTPLL